MSGCVWGSVEGEGYLVRHSFYFTNITLNDDEREPKLNRTKPL